MNPTDPSTLTAEEFGEMFRTFTSTTVRLEALPAYNVDSDAQELADWKARKPRAERSIRTSLWLANIARSTLCDGKRWSRVRVVSVPLTDYERLELEAYIEAQAVGDEVVIARRPDLDAEVGTDVWLFDHGLPSAAAVLMHYHPDGSVDRRELVTGPVELEAIAERIAAVRSHAVPLNEFMVSDLVLG